VLKKIQIRMWRKNSTLAVHDNFILHNYTCPHLHTYKTMRILQFLSFVRQKMVVFYKCSRFLHSNEQLMPQSPITTWKSRQITVDERAHDRYVPRKIIKLNNLEKTEIRKKSQTIVAFGSIPNQSIKLRTHIHKSLIFSWWTNNYINCSWKYL
jgi:hypothetical protein